MTIASWIKLVIGFLITFAIFQWLGAVLLSDRGQAGIVIGVLIVAIVVFFQWLINGGSVRKSLIGLGLGRPAWGGMLVATVVSSLLLAIFPAYSLASGVNVGLATEWLWTVPGLFFQAGIAEETLFRGFLFGNLRPGRSFWRAAVLSALPFAIAHLILFFTLPFPLAMAAFILSVTMSFPFAYLFELAGRTIWAPAMLHFVVQGAIKLVAIQEDAMQGLAIVWIAASAVIPWLVFLWKR